MYLGQNSPNQWYWAGTDWLQDSFANESFGGLQLFLS